MQLGLENELSTWVNLTNFKRDYEPMNIIYKSYFAYDRLTRPYLRWNYRPASRCLGRQ